MKSGSLSGVWTGTAHHNTGWDMDITISISEPFQAGSTLGIFSIPTIPCSGTFRIVSIRGETLELKAENQQGDCGEADSDSLELLSDETLLYVSKGDGWEARGILRRVS